jgi:hypothetical protein
MPSKNQFAFAMYLNKARACVAIEELALAGYRSDRVSLRFPPEIEADELSLRRRIRLQFAAGGAVVGTLVGAAIYGLTGFNAVTFHVIESSMSAGPVGGILTSVIAGGGFAGLIGSMNIIGRPNRIACRYQNRVQNLGYFLSVECEGNVEKRKAEEILKRAGAEDVSCTSVEGLPVLNCPS